METDLLGSGRRTLGTHTILIHGLMTRNRAGVLPQTLAGEPLAVACA